MMTPPPISLPGKVKDKRSNYKNKKMMIKSEILPTIVLTAASPTLSPNILNEIEVEHFDNDEILEKNSFMEVKKESKKDFYKIDNLVSNFGSPTHVPSNLLNFKVDNGINHIMPVKQRSSMKRLIFTLPKRNPFKTNVPNKKFMNSGEIPRIESMPESLAQEILYSQRQKVNSVPFQKNMHKQSSNLLQNFTDDELNSQIIKREKERLRKIMNEDIESTGVSKKKKIISKKMIQFADKQESPTKKVPRKDTPKSLFYNKTSIERPDSPVKKIKDDTVSSSSSDNDESEPEKLSRARPSMTSKDIPRLEIPDNQMARYSMKRDRINSSDGVPSFEEFQSRGRSTTVKDPKGRSRSIMPDYQKFGDLKNCKSGSIFLNTPQDLLSHRQETESVKSNDSNIFKRGMSMLRKRRKSNLFELSSKASVIESEHGETQINQYTIMNTIGKGSFSVIRRAYDTQDKQIYAMKIINVKKMKRTLLAAGKTGEDALETEISILKKVSPKY